jgi:hypothetical protein
MKDHQEGILQLKLCKIRYWMLDIGGQVCIEMCMIIRDHMMHVKEQGDWQLKVLQSWSQVLQKNHL